MASMKDQEWLDWTDKFLALGKSSDIQRRVILKNTQTAPVA